MVPECPWPKNQEDRNRLWEGREPGELPDSNVNKAWSTPQCYWCEDSKASQGRTDQGGKEMQRDKVELWNEKEPLGLPEMDNTAIKESRFHWYEGSRSNPKIDEAWEDPVQLMENALELEEKNAREIKQINRRVKRICWVITLCPVILVASRWLCHWWGVLVLILALTATVVGVQEETEVGDLSPQVLKGMDMSHQAYKLEAFDRDDP